MILLHLFLVLALVGLNAFFVGAEYALLSIRRSRLQQLVREGNPRAVLVHKLLDAPSLLFSGLQLGISGASLLLGWIGEVMLAGYLRDIFSGPIERFAGPAAHVVATAVWFSIITVVLMVLGELAPKTIGYERAEKVSLLLAWPVTVYMRIAHFPVSAMDWMANHVARLVGVVPSIGHSESHTPEEVKLIVAGIRKRGLLRVEQEDMIHSVIDLHRILVREIMVPWPKVTCLPLSNDLNELLDRVVEDQHSRIPIYESSPDSIIGVLFTKDLLKVVLDRRKQGIPPDAPLETRAILHAPMIVPEAMTLGQMLEEARRKHSQMALVVDEFGTYVGLVTIEDVLEQIVGEIEDEYDEEEMAIKRVSEGVFVVDGSLSLRELADEYDLPLPRGVGYETLGGFLLAQFGFIPRGGESLVFEGRRFTVIEMDGRRIARVRVEKMPGVPGQAPAPPLA
jgi:CBS domain containing-hemolysin-like protein